MADRSDNKLVIKNSSVINLERGNGLLKVRLDGNPDLYRMWLERHNNIVIELTGSNTLENLDTETPEFIEIINDGDMYYINYIGKALNSDSFITNTPLDINIYQDGDYVAIDFIGDKGITDITTNTPDSLTLTKTLGVTNIDYNGLKIDRFFGEDGISIRDQENGDVVIAMPSNVRTLTTDTPDSLNIVETSNTNYKIDFTGSSESGIIEVTTNSTELLVTNTDGVANIEWIGKVYKQHKNSIVVGRTEDLKTFDDVDFLTLGSNCGEVINEAIKTAKSLKISTVVLLDGTYVLSEPIVIDVDGIILKGSGNTVIQKNSLQTTAYTAIEVKAKNCIIEKLTVDSSLTSILNSNYGIYIMNPSEGTTLKNLTIKGGTPSAVLSNEGKLIISECKIIDCPVIGINISGTPSTSTFIENVEISNCIFENTTQEAVRARTIKTIVSNNIISNVQETACINFDSQEVNDGDIIISNNIIKNSTTQGISIGGTNKKVSVLNNVISQTIGGINIGSNVENCLISGNLITVTAGTPILDNGENNLLSGNKIS